MEIPKPVVKSSTALRIVKNEKLLCVNCLKSGPLAPAQVGMGDEDQAINCYLNDEPKIKAKVHYCTQGLWMINGKVVDFKEGFQMIYDKEGGENPKEIKI